MSKSILERESIGAAAAPLQAANRAHSPELGRLEARLRSFVRPAAWDGFEAAAITPLTCELACSVVTDLIHLVPHAPLPRVSPSTDGTISLYWHASQDVSHFTLSVHENGKMAIRQKRTGEVAKPEIVPISVAANRLAELFA